MATASDEYQERRRWAHESDSEEQQASPLHDAGLGGIRLIRLDDRQRRGDGICSQCDCASVDLELGSVPCPASKPKPGTWPRAGLRQRMRALGAWLNPPSNMVIR
jgi:hypothetical protein